MAKKLPILGIVAAGSNVGKTTLITHLIPELAKHGVHVSVIKHAHHKFDIDHPGKDSYQIRESGAVQTLIASNQRWALMTELVAEPNLDDLIEKIDSYFCDLILVEGFKSANIPKIEVHRPSLNLPLLCALDSSIIAVASDATVDVNIPVLDLNNVAQLADFICAQFNLWNLD